MSSTPPEWPVGRPRPRPRTLWTDLGRGWDWFRGLPILIQLAVAAVLLVIVVRVLSNLFGSDDGTTVASRSTTSVGRTIPTTSTTRVLPPPLPAGEDRTVRSVIDGDSFELTDGTKIRLIGIDAPDVETRDCFSGEATSHLRELLPTDKQVRIVYDTTRTDRFNRTLAYVYRLPDALFVNVAMARDGFAREQTANSNTARQSEIATAVADARTANRGLWQACSTTATTASSTATTATTQPTGTSSPTTEPSNTTSSSTAPSSTTITRAPGTFVVEGAQCANLGATAVFANGDPAVCTVSLDDPTTPRWVPAA